MSRWRIIGGTAAAAATMAVGGITYFEGVVPYTYADPIGIPTACMGETGPHIQFGQSFTLEECRAMLDVRVQSTMLRLSACLDGVEVTQGQVVALTSWAYNVGTGAACSSTLAKLARAGVSAQTWCPQILRWTKARKLGVVVELPGLVKRRHAETHMCLTGSWPQGADA